VKGREVLMVDDMVSTGGSITDAARIVVEKGAGRVFLAASHAVLAGKAVERLNAAPVEKIIFTDTIPLEGHAIEKLIPASVASLLARAIDRIHRSESVSVLFEQSAQNQNN
jgi:ribose-phosphate pyrophosphokinase